jgi:2-polyprenyl-3-methyl-5-hydroxy-6-metoxy-1,4-benzoquinol methylase
MAVLLDKEPMFEDQSLTSFVSKTSLDSLQEDQKIINEEKKGIDLLQDNSFKYLQKNIDNFDWNSTWSIGLLMRHLNVCRMIENYSLKTKKTHIRLLDVGCSLGLLSDFIQNFKFFGKENSINVHYIGIDGNQTYVDEAQSKGRNVIKSDLFHYSRTLGPNYNALPNSARPSSVPTWQYSIIESYDIVVLAEVFEHIDTTLLDFIQNLWDLLYFRGELFLTTPNPRKEIGEFLVWPDDHKIEYTEKEIDMYFSEHYDYRFIFKKLESFPWWTKKIVNHAKIGETKEYKRLSKFLPVPLAQYMTSLLLEDSGSMMCYLFEKTHKGYN